MVIVDKLGFHNPQDHISIHPEVLLNHLKQVIEIKDKIKGDTTIKIKVMNSESGVDKVVYIDKQYWINLREYIKLLQVLEFNLDTVGGIRINYTMGIKVDNTGKTEEYYQAEYNFITIPPTIELFKSCEADHITNFRPNGITLSSPKVEPNNDCR